MTKKLTKLAKLLTSMTLLNISNVNICEKQLHTRLFSCLGEYLYTHKDKSNGQIALFRCKMAFLKWMWRPIQLEYRNVLYLILKVLNRPLKWDTVRLWIPTGSVSTSRQSWTFEKKLRFSTETSVFFERSNWRPVEADPVGVQRRTVSHFKGLFKTFRMR